MNAFHFNNTTCDLRHHPAAPRQLGFTLVELLVVITIIGILIALLLPAVQAARASARKMQCANNCKQLGVAVLNLESTYGVLPPLCGDGAMGDPIKVNGPYSGAICFTVFSFMLPYLEQGPLYDMSNRNGQTPTGGTVTSALYGTFPTLVCYAPINAFHCPDEPSLSASTGRGAVQWGAADFWGATNYVANFLVFGNPAKPVSSISGPASCEGSARLADITDGTSNTMFFTERYMNCGPGTDLTGLTIYSTLWSNNQNIWRPQFGMNAQGVPLPTSNYTKDFQAYKFQYIPDWMGGGCVTDRPQTPHTGGINACFGDGSQQFLGTDIDPVVWARLVHPRDGYAIDSRW